MKRSRLAPRSDKRIMEASIRELVIAEVEERDRHRCTATAAPGRCASPDPSRKQLEVHEVIPRSAWAAGWLVVDNCRLVCQAHHEWIDKNPDDAEALGLHGRSWHRPDGHCGDAA